MTHSATILLVEDDRSLLGGMSDLLQITDLGYDLNTITADNGLEGLRQLEKAEEPPDLIISDVMMPGMDGFEFLSEVRKNPDWVHIPFIFLTAKGKKSDIMKGRRSGAELYITKPFVSAELLELVKTQLDRTFQLQRAQQQELAGLKRNILQLLNHEFRTPLTYVTAYYEMLADSLSRFEETENLQEYLRGIQAGCVRLTGLTEDLVKIMEIRTGEARAAYEEEARPVTDVGALLRQAGNAVQKRASAAGVTLEYDIPSSLPAVVADPHMLRDALERLVDNAIKFTQVRGEGEKWVRLAAETRNDEVCLSVEDNGVGFPSHVRSRIFDVFVQHDRERLEQQGSGTGLAIVKGTVELHGGRVEAASEAGGGSTFTIVLPAYRPQKTPAGDVTATTPKRATVLVVEDDQHLLIGLKELLEVFNDKYDLRVLTATNGQDGLEQLHNTQPDLIISDVMMPVMDGYDFLHRVRQNSAWLQIPFIFLTAKGEREDILKGRRSGVEEYITKPYDVDELLGLVEAQLDRHFQMQSAASQNFEALKRSILSLLRPDFKGPLDAVTSYSAQLATSLEEAETDEDLMESLQGIQASSGRLTQLVENFITMAEFKTGEAESAFNMRAVVHPNVGALLYEASYAHQSRIEQANVALEYNLTSSLPPVLCDTEALRKSLERLLEIALHLCRQQSDSKIELVAAQRNRSVVLAVRAHGATFPQDSLRQIQAYLRQAGTDFPDIPEYGPNLMVIKNVVNLHGGRVQITTQDGVQTNMMVFLPVHEPEPTPE